MRRITHWLTWVTLLGTALWAQSDLSTIRGVAVDQSGAVVPNLNTRCSILNATPAGPR